MKNMNENNKTKQDNFLIKQFESWELNHEQKNVVKGGDRVRILDPDVQTD